MTADSKSACQNC